MSELEHGDAGTAGDEIARLTRRVARERSARLAAEEQAEGGLRALYQRQRQAELMHAIASAANEATSPGTALSSCLESVCKHLGWPVGHAWTVEGDGRVVSSAHWYIESHDQFRKLRAVTEQAALAPGESLPGRVLANGQPAWIEDVATDPMFVRGSAGDLGVHAAFALPVLIGREVVAVLEFFAIDPRPVDEAVLELGKSIGAQLGRVIERRRAGEALRRARDELEQRVRDRTAELEEVNRELRKEIAERDAADAANRAKSEFLANMSHEIRTPMTAVLGYADLLLDTQISPTERLDYVQTIRRNGEHLLSILNDILDLSKIEAGKMTVERIDCSPVQVVVDVASLMRVRALDKGLDFKVEFATPMPMHIQSDPTRLRQVLMNLAGNAIKFTQSGSVRLTVRCDGADAPRPKISFEVVDQGIGMSREQVEALFTPFSQADQSMTRRFGGTGLGLAICKRLADMLGGTIEVTSQPGLGSTFTLSLVTASLSGVTFLDDVTEGGGMVALQAAAPPERVRIDGASVLLAEDGRDNQLLVSTYLKKGGARVIVVENGLLALQVAMEAHAAGRPFDVILMDMQMPELDGYGATSRLRARGYTRPIVALTAHAMAGDRERCIGAGCDDYMTKPVNRDDLLGMVHRHMDRARTLPPVAPLYSDLDTDDDIAELVRTFVASLPDRQRSLRDAFDRGDLVGLMRLAHQLKGAGGGYGFQPITDAAERLEHAARGGSDRAAIERCLGELNLVLQRARSTEPDHALGGGAS